MNTNRKAIFISLAIAIAGACVFIFEGIYQEAESAAITKLNQQQMIYARQAARGIEEFFATWTGGLNALSQMNAVVADDSEGTVVLKLFYETNQARIMEISRVDEKGVIRDDFPDRNAVGCAGAARDCATAQNGMGLGLSVCRTIINAHGGKLWAEHNSGRGATFYLRLQTAEPA